MADTNLISLSDINRTFTLGDSKVYALRNIHLQIYRKEYISIMGPSGSGKSTALNLIDLLDRADSGTYLLENRDVTTLDPDDLAIVRSEYIGFIFQSFHLVPRLSAAENIELPLILFGMHATERKKRVSQALHEYGLSTRANHKSNELSGGQRQRLALARALVKDPAVLILDDALSAVDTRTESSILAALKSRQGRQTTLIVAHRLSSVMQADRIVVLDAGSIVQLGSHQELASIAGPYRQLCELQAVLPATAAVPTEPNNQSTTELPHG